MTDRYFPFYLLFCTFSGRAIAFSDMGVWKLHRPDVPGILYRAYLDGDREDELLFVWAPLRIACIFSKVTFKTLSAYLNEEKRLRPYYRERVWCHIVLPGCNRLWILDRRVLRSVIRSCLYRRISKLRPRKIRSFS